MTHTGTTAMALVVVERLQEDHGAGRDGAFENGV